ncbi:hypothetical protein LCGC14_2519670 [marine sediment metagenome]|uniref:Uncharacterized protein n=1 Tax=marine sediment metagenome TaxID=412755 RepID=A0A0F9AWS3_9ZZZZ
MSRVREATAFFGPFGGGVAFFPYQLALGVSLRYWQHAPAFRVYLGPFKLWGYVSLGARRGGEGE